jgi:hypothetical protein
MNNNDYWLDKSSRRLLKILKRDFTNADPTILELYSKIKNKTLSNEREFVLTVDFLAEHGYLTKSSLDFDSCRLALTQTGRHYRERTYYLFKKRIFESIIAPIIVAFITTVATLWLSGILTEFL